MKIDLGCGPNKREGFVGLDQFKFPGVDKVVNLGKARLPFKDKTVDEVHASHFVEHLDAVERCHLFNELYRVMKPGATMAMIVPHWGSSRAYGDPTHCFSDDTDILTSSGWKKITDVAVGELVPSLDLATEKTLMVPVASVINHPYVGKMLHFKTINMDLMVTPNHDMVWRAKGGNGGYWKRKGKLPPRPKLRKSAADTFLGMGGPHPRVGLATLDWMGESPYRIRIADDEKSLGRVLSGEFDAGDFAELMGWYVSEGYVDLSSKDHYRISICQSRAANPEKYGIILALLKRMGFKAVESFDRLTFSSKPLALYLKKLGLSHQKYVPAVIKTLSAPLLKRFLDAAIMGDGRVNGSGWEYATVSSRLADDVQEIALKVGYRTSLRLEARPAMAGVINGRQIMTRQDLFMVGISPPADLWYPVPEAVTYSGNIVCVTLAHTNNIMVRRNGKPMWSGNCWPPIGEMWFCYLSRAWRASQAPHTDKKNWAKGYDCDFEFTYGYSVHPALITRNDEFKQFAVNFYREGAQDIQATLIRK